ncbi:MAG: flagellar motor protein MotB [Proteobacteria bacterium]|nr:flagellar motor protein MotB [Pseudomonadota bacterium]MDE3207302.1 flagellar motor protein MotB [Pseudomonadota bacterium]
MAESKQQNLIVIKRSRKQAAAFHGGAWKIALADMMTAMMAFFLLMWLLGSTTKGQLEGIADYFRTPLKVALSGGDGSGDSSSVIKGGGTDLTRSTGQVDKSNQKIRKSVFSLNQAKAIVGQHEKLKFIHLKQKLEQAINSNPDLKKYRDQILMDFTPQGLRIQIVDKKNRPMFDLGSVNLKPYTIKILAQITQLINQVNNQIAITGHTDSAPYAGGEKGYSNWELSTDRANACRQIMVSQGLKPSKVLRIIGTADAVPFDPKNPLDPMNRRISILIMTKAAADAAKSEGAGLHVNGAFKLTPKEIGTPAHSSHG